MHYYFAVPVYPNSQMPPGVLLLALGKLCKQLGWRVVIDEAKNAASRLRHRMMCVLLLGYKLALKER